VFAGALFDSSPIALLSIIGTVWQMRKTTLTTLVHDLFGNRPRDRPFVGHAHDHAFFTFKQTHRVFLQLEWLPPIIIVNPKVTGKRDW
jgi:hypothetical protein